MLYLEEKVLIRQAFQNFFREFLSYTGKGLGSLARNNNLILN